MSFELMVGLIIAAGIALWYFWPKADINNDGKVDLNDAKAAVDKVEAKIVEEAKKIEEKALVEAKKVEEVVKTEVVETVKKVKAKVTKNAKKGKASSAKSTTKKR
jgi:hypothetical protein